MPTSIGSTPVRADSDAILVGAATVRNDNLRLDGRDYMVAPSC
jgi:riboflavin biosynthesis pyrimidine reductase